MPLSHRPRLSALIVARNEEKRLAECLESVRFCDEIVVQLDRSTDRSAEIAHAYTDKLIEGAWEFQGERRMVGINACGGDWILEVDADERIDATLAQSIRRFLDENPAFGCAQARFHNYVGTRLVRHGWGAYNGIASKYLLFAKGAKIWDVGGRIHPRITLKGEKTTLKGAVIHHVDDDISDMFARLGRYTTSNAKELLERKEPLDPLHVWIRRFFTRFLKVYIQRKGYKEGYMGLMLGLFAGLYPLLSYLKAREMLDAQRRSHEGPS